MIRNVSDALALASTPNWPHTLQLWKVGRSGELAPGIEVWTSWLPCSGYYETLVVNRNEGSGGEVEGFDYRARTDSLWDAIDNHADVTRRLRRFLAEREVV